MSRQQHLRAQLLQVPNGSLHLRQLRIGQMKAANDSIERDAAAGNLDRMPSSVDDARMAAAGEDDQAAALDARRHQPLVTDQRVLDPGAGRRVKPHAAPQPQLVHRAARDLAADDEGAVAHRVCFGVQRRRAACGFDLGERGVRFQRDGALWTLEAAEGGPVRVQVDC